MSNKLKKHYLPDSPYLTAFPISNSGYPYIFSLAFTTLIFALLNIKVISLLFLLTTFFVCFFFRDPERLILENSSSIVSPADGKVIDVSIVENTNFFEKKSRKISIFMSILNVHVNRAPIGGIVKKIQYNPGKFFSANLDKASKVNESNSVLIESSSGLKLAYVQIAGLVARRIVSSIKPGDLLIKGQRIGLICFGSRLDVFFPLDVKVLVMKGDKVNAGSSILGELVISNQDVY